MGAAPRQISRSEYEAAKLRAERAQEQLAIASARACPIAFCEYVGRDKGTGEPLKLQPYHRAYIRALLLPIWDQIPEIAEDLNVSGSAFLPASGGDVVGLGHPESGKTELAMLVALWLMSHMIERGRWPNLWWAGDTKAVALRRATETAGIIEGKGDVGEAFKRVFPKIERGAKWNTDGWYVAYDGETAPGRDPTILAAGRDTGVHGGRFSLGIFDDVQTRDNQRLPGSRERVHTQFVQKVLDRRGKLAYVWFLTNAWFEDSSDAKLVQGGFREYKLTVRDPKTGRLNFPMMWDEQRIEQESSGPAASVPGEVERRLMCKRLPRGASSRFKLDHVKGCYAYDLTLKTGGITVRDIPKGARIYTGVDIGGVNKKSASDETCFFTIMAVPGSQKRRILNVETGRWDKVELGERATSIYNRFHVTRADNGQIIARHPGDFIVESNAMQRYIAQDLGINLPVRPFTTGKNKHDMELGVDAMAGEFALGMWEIPVGQAGVLAPELESWQSELVGYSPDVHTGDRVMASWFARMGALEDHDYMMVDPDGLTLDEADALVEEGEKWAKPPDDKQEREEMANEALWEDVAEVLGDAASDSGPGGGWVDDSGYGVF